jgi:hypothetical protein
MPPITTIAKIIAQQANSHSAMARSLDRDCRTAGAATLSDTDVTAAFPDIPW